MANNLKQIQEQKLAKLKLTLDRDELQNYYNTHTYKETAEYYRITYDCSIKNLKLLFIYFGIERKGRGSNLVNDREKLKQGMIDKYGVDNPQKSKEIRERTRQTNLARYGTENAFQNTEIQAKQKQTCLDRYGVANVFQAEAVKNTIKHTCLERYGVEHISKHKETIIKTKQTKLECYGDDGYHNFEQAKTTNLKKHGRANFVNPDKAKQTCLMRYGVDNVAKVRATHINAAKTRAKAVALDGTVFDSSWEVIVYEYAKQKNYTIERQIPIYYNDGNQTTFIDFRINGQFYEVKGPHLLKNCWLDKGVVMDKKVECYRENDVIVITDTCRLNQNDWDIKLLDIYNLTF